MQKNFAKFIEYNLNENSFVVNNEKSNEFDSAIIQSVQGDSNLVTKKEEIYPLYNVSSLRKHGEHYS